MHDGDSEERLIHPAERSEEPLAEAAAEAPLDDKSRRIEGPDGPYFLQPSQSQ